MKVAGCRRPAQFDEDCPIYRASLAVPGVDYQIIHTGQYYD
jgi:hypothetical protein